jgi:hypothetical protein
MPSKTSPRFFLTSSYSQSVCHSAKKHFSNDLLDLELISFYITKRFLNFNEVINQLNFMRLFIVLEK